MPEELPIGRVVVRAVAAALCVAAAMACFALLRGDFGDTDWKVIATSLLFALVSATAGSGLAVRPAQPVLGAATFALSLGTFALLLVGLWGEVDSDAFWRTTGCLGVGTLEGAHASFVLSRRRDDDPEGTVAATRAAVALAVASGIVSVLPISGVIDDDVDEGYYQVLGVLLVLQLLATALAPLLRRLGPAQEPAGTAPAAAGDRLARELLDIAAQLERADASPEVRAQCARLRQLAAERS